MLLPSVTGLVTLQVTEAPSLYVCGPLLGFGLSWSE
jgi:hypothetical protein